MEFRAEARYMRVSPQKARLVLNLIKGQRVEDAPQHAAVHKKARGGDGREAVALGAWRTRTT